jgi:hypothetical protein
VQKRGVRNEKTASCLVVTNVQWMKHDRVLEEDDNGFTPAGTCRNQTPISVKTTRCSIVFSGIIPAPASKCSSVGCVVHRDHRALSSQAQVLVGQPLEPTTIDRPPSFLRARQRPCLILLGRQVAKTLPPGGREERGPARAVTAALAEPMMTIQVKLHQSVSEGLNEDDRSQAF